jgi:hypothetical protein
MYLKGGLFSDQDDVQLLTVEVRNDPAAPVEILECESSEIKDPHHSSGRTCWRLWVKIRNVTTTTIVRYDLRFIAFDVYGNQQEAFEGFSTDRIKPRGDVGDNMGTVPIAWGWATREGCRSARAGRLLRRYAVALRPRERPFPDRSDSRSLLLAAPAGHGRLG